MAMLEVKVDGLALDMTTNSPVVILCPLESKKVLPIWIGHSEAWAIAMELSGVAPKRPMTHDLLKAFIESVAAKVERVEITELKEQTFFARIKVESDGKLFELDARPSDSIALALKMGAPMYAEEALFNLSPPGDPQLDEKIDKETLKDRLKKINPEDFGKYSL